ncbi:hypothetical protein IFM89_035510 [Coptis chinensis]|uniref:Uncharacterized protein n=1 Tax=Coptis chinensis TaxID=261450 RepID=A0A835LHH3_9MAGN|nr:hypothetical protein IFM89_035510 [Coptis chinensis]
MEMLDGIPNVGKLALANSLHHIGRISAAGKAEACNCDKGYHQSEVKIGWPGYRVTKQFDPETKQRSFLFQTHGMHAESM